MRRILILPPTRTWRTRASTRLMRTRRPRSPGGVQVRDLYALYPDYLIDVAAEQRALAGAAGGVAAPDALVRHAAADEAVAGRGVQLRLGLRPGRPALQGKDLWLATSTGGPESSPTAPAGTNRHFFDAFLPPYEQTAALAGMRFLPPLVLHGAHRATDRDRRRMQDVRRPACDLPRLARNGRAGRRCASATTVPADLLIAAERRRTEGPTRWTTASWLTDQPVYLAAAVLAVPLARALGLGAIIGYLGAGIADRPLGAEAGHRPAGDAALRRVRRRADALPGRPGTGAAPAVGDAAADLRLGQRAAARRGAR
jgi:glutathione-regulated potassium-efflux system ancillary protein KefF